MIFLTANVVNPQFFFERGTRRVQLLLPRTVHVSGNRDYTIVAPLTPVHNIIAQMSFAKTALIVDSFDIIRLFPIAELLLIGKVSSI